MVFLFYLYHIKRNKYIMNTNFENHMEQYCTERGFVPNSKSPLWQSSLKSFSIYSIWYQNVMPYSFFIKNCIK